MQKKKKRSEKASADDPVRKLKKVSPHRTVSSIFVEGLTPYPAESESYAERYCLATLCLCQDVFEIRTQPSVEHYVDETGKPRRYTPDLLLKTSAGDLVVEIKTLNYLFQPDGIEKYRQIGAHFASLRRRFAFLTDAQIEDGSRFKNVKIFFRYAHSRLREHALQKISEADLPAAVTVAELMKQLGLELVDIYTAIAQKHLTIEWDQPLSIDSPVSRPYQPIEGLTIENILSSSRYGPLLAELALGIAPADRTLLASGAAWRKPKSVPNPFTVIGGFQSEAPLRNLSEDELRVGTVWERRNRAPGKTRGRNIETKSVVDGLP